MNQSAERMPSGAMSDEPAGMGDARERRNPLLETALFKQVSEEQASELVPYLHHEEYDKGEYIFTEGDTDQRMYVIQEGRVKLTRQSVDKRVQLLSIHTRGELLGEIPVFDPQGGPRTANAVAMVDGTQVPHDLTQEEMAQLVGSSRETVNKALMDFANRGWIARNGRTIIIYQPGALIRRSQR